MADYLINVRVEVEREVWVEADSQDEAEAKAATEVVALTGGYYPEILWVERPDAGSKPSIQTGDGSMQKRLDAGQCPKCGTALSYQLVPDTGWEKCSTCGLQVSQQ